MIKNELVYGVLVTGVFAILFASVMCIIVLFPPEISIYFLLAPLGYTIYKLSRFIIHKLFWR